MMTTFRGNAPVKVIYLCQQLLEHVERMTGDDSDVKVGLKLFAGLQWSVRYWNHFVGYSCEVHKVFRWRIQVGRKLADTGVQICPFDFLSHQLLHTIYEKTTTPCLRKKVAHHTFLNIFAQG